MPPAAGERLHTAERRSLRAKTQKLHPNNACRDEQVNKFKAFVIGGGGIFSDKHAPLYFDMFAGELTVPIVVMGVGARWGAVLCVSGACAAAGKHCLSAPHGSWIEEPAV